MAENVEDHPAAGKPRASWGKRLSSVIAAMAAVAGIITAVVTLWPGPDVADNATITSASVRVPEQLSEFVQRAVISPLNSRSAARHPAVRGAHASHLELSGAVRPAATAQSAAATAQRTATAQATATAQPTASAQPTTAPSASSFSPATEGSSTPVNSPSVRQSPSSVTSTSHLAGSANPHAVSNPPIAEISEAERNSLYDNVRTQPALQSYLLAVSSRMTHSSLPKSSLTAIPAVMTETLDAQGDPLPAEVAAARLAARLDAGRSVPSHGKRDPVGALVTINMELQGLSGQPLLLLWRLFPADGASPLPENWWKTTVAYRLTPGTDDDSASLDMWVPLPKGKGPYTLNLLVASENNGVPLTSFDTVAFH